MPSLRILLLVALLFLAVVLLRLPAAWVVGALPAPLVCEAPRGTAWNGQCGALRVGNTSLSNLSWQLLPGELLHAKLGVRAQLDDPALQASGKALLGLQRHLQGYDLVVKMSLPSALAPGTPTGWTGRMELDLPRFEAQGMALRSVHGVVQLRDLQQARPRIDFGSFEWQLADGPISDGQLRGTLRALGGPLRLQGTLVVGLQGSFDLDARVAAAADAGEALQHTLRQLSPADAEGFHPLLASGTF